jgi:hypothetical protein
MLDRGIDMHRLARVSSAVAVCFAVSGAVAGCSGGTASLQKTLDAGQLAASADSRSFKPVAVVAMVPLQGPPAAVTERLTRQLNQAAAAKQIALMVDPTLQSEYTMRGYILSAAKREPSAKPKAARGKTPLSLTVSYLWDVTDRSGTRVTRITGEEIVERKPSSGRDLWADVTDAVTLKVAERTAGALGDALRNRSPQVAANQPVVRPLAESTAAPASQ